MKKIMFVCVLSLWAVLSFAYNPDQNDLPLFRPRLSNRFDIVFLHNNLSNIESINFVVESNFVVSETDFTSMIPSSRNEYVYVPEIISENEFIVDFKNTQIDHGLNKFTAIINDESKEFYVQMPTIRTLSSYTPEKIEAENRENALEQFESNENEDSFVPYQLKLIKEPF